MALVLAKPAFQKKRDAEAERDEPEPKAARLVAEAKATAHSKAGKGNRRGNMDDETLEQLVLALGRLVTQNSSELREIQAVCLTTFLIDAVFPPIQAGLEAGQTFQKLVVLQKAKKGKQPALATSSASASASASAVEVEEENLGSPHVMVALAVLPAMAILPGMTPTQQQIMKNWWDKILDKSEEEIAREIPVFRVRKPQVATALQKKGKKTVPSVPYAKLQFAVKDYQVQDILCSIMINGGGMEKAGPAPRGFLERQARELLEKVSKKK